MESQKQFEGGFVQKATECGKVADQTTIYKEMLREKLGVVQSQIVEMIGIACQDIKHSSIEDLLSHHKLLKNVLDCFESGEQADITKENDNIFIDLRDGERYRTVEINGKIWMAENLRYRTGRCRAPMSRESLISKHGCLYTWFDATTICPEGWHLPSREELESLLTVAGCTQEAQFDGLVSTMFSGNNTTGFNALLSGGEDDHDYCTFGHSCNFWSSTDVASDIKEAVSLYISIFSTGYAELETCYKNDYCSIRCIKN